MQLVTLAFEIAKHIAGCINKRCETRPSTSHDAPNQSKQQQSQNAVAKPEIWKEGAKFKESYEKLMAETVKLEAAAKSGNLDSIKTAFGATGGSCKNCHDSFQVKAN